ncbi:MAG: AMP-binding protein [Actinomycetia bacterium]|nr:AMP-binding protein [Actinomycetes bacterium]MCP4963307.1 AMP-binding protein [Actinomycetes bacterium]
MTGWNFADVWETNAAAVPERDVLVHGDTHISWGELNRRANGVAASLLAIDGMAQQDKVAQYMYNCAEFMESQFAIFKAGMVPVNTNYRYTESELFYLWDNADAVAVVFHGMFTEHIEHIHERLPDIKVFLWVDDGSGPCPSWATPYEAAALEGTEDNVSGPWGRSGDDLYMLYTGGTTGKPKGVMWPQDELMKIYRAGNPELPEEVDLDHVAAKATGPARVGTPCCPLMHGTGAFTSHSVMHSAGTIVTLTNHHFEADELIDTVEREGVNTLAIVGDAFAKPIVRALDARRGTADISSLVTITSSGVIWSQETKEGLLRHNPNMTLIDAFSSSEALGMGQSVSTGTGTVKTAKFELGERAIVVDDDNNRVTPGSGQIGRVAVRGILPIGYFKDPEKTAGTFITIEGERFSTPGDYATVEADGSLTLLGRGSVCINTGGEKVFPEEVEERLKTHPSIHDAVVVGVPDERFGQAVTGVVELERDAALDVGAVIAHVRAELAGYKTPKRLVAIDTIGRAANGKVDYKRLSTYAASNT